MNKTEILGYLQKLEELEIKQKEIVKLTQDLYDVGRNNDKQIYECKKVISSHLKNGRYLISTDKILSKYDDNISILDLDQLPE